MWSKNKHLLLLASLALFFGVFSLLTSTASASTGVSPDVSFEGKIVNSSGVNITNATYNVEFTMYTGCSNEPTNNTGCTLAWTEDYLTSATEGVAMNGGTFEVNLGQYCAFSGGSCQGNTNTGINWNTYPIYMSMQIGGTTNCTPAGNFTTNCSGDGVMQPYILMTSTPYAQNAGTLGGLASGSFAQLAAGSQTFTGANTFEDSTNSTTALQVENNSAKDILNVDTTNAQVDVGALSAPGTLTATQAPLAGSLTGTAGSTSYTYEITAVSANGAESLAATETNASLASSITTHNITVNWTTNGASYYKIYRTASAGTPSSLGLVGTSTTGSFVDTGYSAGAQPPSLANSGTLAVSTNYYYEVTALDDTYTTTDGIGQTSPSAQVTATTNSYNKSLTISWAPVNGARAYNVYRSTTSGVFTTDSYYTVQTNSFTDTNATATGTNTVPPTTSSAYGNDLSDNAAANITIGSSGTSTAQLYVGGSVPTTAIGTISTGSSSRPSGVAVQGNYTYVSTYGTSTFEVYNTSNPANPILVGSTPLTGGDGISISGQYAYVVDYSTGYLFVVNISNPASPTVVAQVSTGTNPSSIYIQGRYAYVTNTAYSSGSPTLEVFDLANPTDPVPVGTPVATGVQPYSVYVQGNYAYVTNIGGTNSLEIFNVSNPASIVAVSTIATASDPNDIYVQGNYAYVVDTMSSELQVFDISNPNNPVVVGSFTTSSAPNSIYVQGRMAYIVEDAASVQAVDISNPADPLNDGTVGTGTGVGSGEASQLIVVQGRYGYMISDISSNNLQIFDLGGAYVQQLQAGGEEVGTLTVDNNATIVGGESITGGLGVGGSAEIYGNLGINGGLTIAGVVPANITVAASVAANSYNSYASGSYDYALSGNTMQIYDITNPTNPLLVSTIAAGLNPYDVYVQGQYAYVVDDGDGSYDGTSAMLVYNVSNASNPILLSTTPSSWRYDDSIYVQGSYAYVTDFDSTSPNMAIYDISNPADPVLVSSISTYSSTASVFVQGDYAYITNQGGLGIFNVTNPADPVLVSYFATSNVAVNVYVQGDYAYVTDDSALEVVDVANPADPTEAGIIFSLSSTWGSYSPSAIDVQGDTAYITTAGDNIAVINVTNPDNLIYEGSIATTNEGDGISIEGNYAYVPNGALQVYNLNGTYLQSLQASSVQVSSLVVSTNAQVAGDESINGGLTVSSSAQVIGNTSVGSLNITDGLTTPNTPSEAVTCSATCTSSYSYAVDANNGSGSSGTSVSASALANATLNTTTNYIDTTWSAVSGATYYNVYRTAGGAAQGLIGTINNTSALTPTAASETGSVLTLTFAQTPPWVVGQAMTLSGFTSTPTNVNGTWPITAVTATTVTLNITSGATTTVSVRGSATGILGFFDMAQTANANLAFPTIATAGTIGLQTSSSQALDVANALGNSVFNVGTGSSSIFLRQQNTVNDPTASTTQTITLTSAVPAGDTLVLESGEDQSYDVTSITGDGVTWQLATSYNDCIDSRPCNAGDLETWYGLNSTGAAAGATITVTYSGTITAGGVNGLIVTDWAGVASFDSAGTSYTTSITALKNTPTLTPSTSGELVMVAADFNSSSSPLASPYTTLPFDGDNAAGYLIDPGATPTYGSWPLNASDNDDLDIAAFKPTSAGASGVTVVGNTTVSGATNLNGQVAVGSIGTATSQLYVGGNSPANSVGSIATGTNPYDTYVQGNYAYVVNYAGNSLQIFDVTNPASPVLVGSVATGTNPESVYVSGRYAYVGNDGSSTLQIFDVSNPASPVQVSSIGTGGGGVSSVYVSGRYAYVTNVNGFNFQIYDVGDPTSPVLVGTATTLQNPYSIFVQGNYAYVTAFTGSELQIYNISNPAAPINVGNVATTGNPRYVYVQGDYAYIANQGNGTLQVFNVATPNAPVLVGTATAGSDPESLYVQGRYAYVANENSTSFQIFDISTPSNPTLDETTTTDAYPQSIFVSGRYAYVADNGSSQLQIFDLGGAYIQQLQVGGEEVDTLSVDNSAIISGSESVTGGLSVSGATQLLSNVSAGGLSIDDGLTTPATPTETATCASTCTSSYSYAVAATNPSGTSAVSSTASASDNATLNTTTNYVQTSWAAVSGASSYNVYRTAGGAAQGLIGTVSYTTALTPTSGSETGTTLTLNFASAPPWAVGQAITLAGFTMNTGTVNGTWPILSVTATSITINHLAGVTSTITTEGTATGDLAFYDTAQTANTSQTAPAIATAGTADIQTSSTEAFQVDNAQGAPIFLVSTIGNNLLTYPGFEAGSFTSDTAGWQSVGTGTISQNAILADTYNGLYSLKLGTTTTAGAGAQTDSFTEPVAAGTYDVSFYAYPSVAMSASAFTVTLDDTTTHTCSPAAATLSTAGFTLLNCSVTTTGNLTYLSITQNDTTARTIYIDAVQLQTGSSLTPYSIGSIQLRAPVTNPVTFEAPSNSQTTFQILNASNANLLNVDSLDGVVEIGSTSSTNTTQTLLQLNSDSTLGEVATCSTTTNQGALYYNNASNNIRACIGGVWQDLVSTQGLATLLFGVVPNSGTNPGDLIGASATATVGSNTGGPCKVNFDTTTSVYVNSCLAYSGGREVTVTNVAVSTAGVAASSYQNICLNTAGVPVLLGSASTTNGDQTFNTLTSTNGNTYGQPLLCLATILTSTTAGHLAKIYDARTFTNTTKSYASIATAADGYLGSMMTPSGTAGFVVWSSSATGIVEGVVVASTGVNGTAGSPNIMIAIAGPQWMFANGGTLNDFIVPTTTDGAVGGTATTGLDAFDMVGVELNTYATGCTVQTFGASDCQYSLFTYMNIQ